MDDATFSVVMGFAGVFLAALLGFLGNKKGTLASAEKDFRQTILQDNENLRKRIEQLEQVNKELQTETATLKSGVQQSGTQGS